MVVIGPPHCFNACIPICPLCREHPCGELTSGQNGLPEVRPLPDPIFMSAWIYFIVANMKTNPTPTPTPTPTPPKPTHRVSLFSPRPPPPPPPAASRRGFLQHHLSEAEERQLARRCHGFVGADLKAPSRPGRLGTGDILTYEKGLAGSEVPGFDWLSVGCFDWLPGFIALVSAIYVTKRTPMPVPFFACCVCVLTLVSFVRETLGSFPTPRVSGRGMISAQNLRGALRVRGPRRAATAAAVPRPRVRAKGHWNSTCLKPNWYG